MKRIFNLQDPPFNAAGDGITDDLPALQAALRAVQSSGRGTILVPPGDYALSGGWGLASGASQVNLAIRGDSRKACRFVSKGPDGGLFDFSGAIQSTLDMSGVGLISGCASGPNREALRLTYGDRFFDDETWETSTLEELEINGGNWTSGIALINGWRCWLDKIYGLGSPSNYTKGSKPGAGDGGAGTGAFIRLSSGVNMNLGILTADFWGQGLVLDQAGQPGDNIHCQGINIDFLGFVECIESVRVCAGLPGFQGATEPSRAAVIQLSKYLLDNGNLDVAGHRGFVLESMDSFKAAEGWIGCRNGMPIIFDDTTDCQFTNVGLNCGNSLPQDHAILYRNGSSNNAISGINCLGVRQLSRAESGTDWNVIEGLRRSVPIPSLNLGGPNNRLP